MSTPHRTPEQHSRSRPSHPQLEALEPSVLPRLEPFALAALPSCQAERASIRSKKQRREERFRQRESESCSFGRGRPLRRSGVAVSRKEMTERGKEENAQRSAFVETFRESAPPRRLCVARARDVGYSGREFAVATKGGQRAKRVVELTRAAGKRRSSRILAGGRRGRVLLHRRTRRTVQREVVKRRFSEEEKIDAPCSPQNSTPPARWRTRAVESSRDPGERSRPQSESRGKVRRERRNDGGKTRSRGCERDGRADEQRSDRCRSRRVCAQVNVRVEPGKSRIKASKQFSARRDAFEKQESEEAQASPIPPLNNRKLSIATPRFERRM
jgi:hypothetical protein